MLQNQVDNSKLLFSVNSDNIATSILDGDNSQLLEELIIKSIELSLRDCIMSGEAVKSFPFNIQEYSEQQDQEKELNLSFDFRHYIEIYCKMELEQIKNLKTLIELNAQKILELQQKLKGQQNQCSKDQIVQKLNHLFPQLLEKEIHVQEELNRDLSQKKIKLSEMVMKIKTQICDKISSLEKEFYLTYAKNERTGEINKRRQQIWEKLKDELQRTVKDMTEQEKFQQKIESSSQIMEFVQRFQGADETLVKTFQNYKRVMSANKEMQEQQEIIVVGKQETLNELDQQQQKLISTLQLQENDQLKDLIQMEMSLLQRLNQEYKRVQKQEKNIDQLLKAEIETNQGLENEIKILSKNQQSMRPPKKGNTLYYNLLTLIICVILTFMHWQLNKQ